MEWFRYQLGFCTFEWNTKGFPPKFNGVAEPKPRQCNQVTPCHGARCGGPKNGKHRWHPAGTEMLVFKDGTVDGPAAWQRMCVMCALLEGHLRTTSVFIKKERLRPLEDDVSSFFFKKSPAAAQKSLRT